MTTALLPIIPMCLKRQFYRSEGISTVVWKMFWLSRSLEGNLGSVMINLGPQYELIWNKYQECLWGGFWGYFPEGLTERWCSPSMCSTLWWQSRYKEVPGKAGLHLPVHIHSLLVSVFMLLLLVLLLLYFAETGTNKDGRAIEFSIFPICIQLYLDYIGNVV